MMPVPGSIWSWGREGGVLILVLSDDGATVWYHIVGEHAREFQRMLRENWNYWIEARWLRRVR